MKLILLRHGETVWNKERRLQGQTDIPLSPEGIRMIREAADNLTTLQIHIDRILSSPLGRAMETARHIASHIDYPENAILADPLFTERSFGAGEGLTYEEAMARYPDNTYPGMESLEELTQRACCAINRCMHLYSDETVLVTSHGAMIKAVLCALTRGKIGYFDEDIWIENGSFCVLECDISADSEAAGRRDCTEYGWKILLYPLTEQGQPIILYDTDRLLIQRS